MARKDEDLTNMTFGLLHVNKFYGLYDHKRYWLCDCKCGTKNVLAYTKQLKNHTKKSCGCLRKSTACQMGKSNKQKNNYNLSGEYGIGYTSKGEEFYFDLEDYDKIKNYCWSINNDGYVVCMNENIQMHRFLLNIENKDIEVDHINHRTNDNRKCKLRLTTHSENCMNRKFPTNTASGVTGVTWCENIGKWRVRIGVNNKRITLGYYTELGEAIMVRKKAENEYFGEYSYDNSYKEECI